MANRYVNPYKVMLGECTRKEIREALQRDELKAAIIPIGAIEQHNEHLSLDLDIVLSTFISQQAALQLGAPSHPINVNSSLRSSRSRQPCNSILKSLSLHLVRWVTPRITWHGRGH